MWQEEEVENLDKRILNAIKNNETPRSFFEECREYRQKLSVYDVNEDAFIETEKHVIGDFFEPSLKGKFVDSSLFDSWLAYLIQSPVEFMKSVSFRLEEREMEDVWKRYYGVYLRLEGVYPGFDILMDDEHVRVKQKPLEICCRWDNPYVAFSLHNGAGRDIGVLVGDKTKVMPTDIGAIIDWRRGIMQEHKPKYII